MIFETERLIIRNVKVEDAEDQFEYSSDPEVASRASFPPHESVEVTRKLIEERFAPNPDVHALILKENNKMIGTIELRSAHKKNSFDGLNLPDNTHEIGACLSRKYWNGGYMTEAANRMLEYAFEDLKSEGVYATTSSKNFASQRLQEKLGMTYIDSIPRERPWIDGTENVTQRRGITREEYYKRG